MEDVEFEISVMSYRKEKVIKGERDPDSATKLEDDEDFFGEERDCE